MKNAHQKNGIIGLCGHTGVGHTHSHSGFVQDDSAGFTVVASILKSVLPIQSKIAKVDIDLQSAMITVITTDGGVGKATVRRGITPFEKEMMQDTIGKDAIYSQRIVLKTFGRIYGQGAMESAVSFQAALSLAIIDTFARMWPENIDVVTEDIGENIGKILGTVILIHDIPVSLLLTVNATNGGIGPVEDVEGNIPLGNKGALMHELGMLHIPTIIVESKCFIKEENVDGPTHFIRANQTSDNITVAQALIDATRELHLPVLYDFNTLERNTNDYRQMSIAFSEQIIKYGKALKQAESATEKVQIVANLAEIVSEDAGGITFMSNHIQKEFGSAGMIQGTSAVLSLLVSKDYIDYHKIPYMTETDVAHYCAIIEGAIQKLHDRLDMAKKELSEKYYLSSPFK